MLLKTYLQDFGLVLLPEEGVRPDRCVVPLVGVPQPPQGAEGGLVVSVVVPQLVVAVVGRGGVCHGWDVVGENVRLGVGGVVVLLKEFSYSLVKGVNTALNSPRILACCVTQNSGL